MDALTCDLAAFKVIAWLFLLQHAGTPSLLKARAGIGTGFPQRDGTHP